MACTAPCLPVSGLWGGSWGDIQPVSVFRIDKVGSGFLEGVAGFPDVESKFLQQGVGGSIFNGYIGGKRMFPIICRTRKVYVGRGR